MEPVNLDLEIIALEIGRAVVARLIAEKRAADFSVENAALKDAIEKLTEAPAEMPE